MSSCSDSDFSRSDSRSLPSTAPSSPAGKGEESYLVIIPTASSEFSNSVVLQPESGECILLLSGSGTAVDALSLLSKAQKLLGLPTPNTEKWEWPPAQGSPEIQADHIKPRLDEKTVSGLRQLFMNGQKISHSDELNRFTDLHLRSVVTFTSTLAPNLTLRVLERPSFVFQRLSLTSSHSIRNPTGTPYGVPALAEWKEMWKAWDLVSLGMIPQEMLHTKPIDLRHKCLFYLGHIPTFVNILLSKLLKEPYTEPVKFTTIFERGIDPHVDDPDHCHNHSEVPERDEDWPTLSEIISYRDRIRQRVINLYEEIESGKRPLTRRMGRTLMMTLEHEGFHIETLLYMLIQRADGGVCGTLPPPGFRTPFWGELVEEWKAIPPPVEKSVVIGQEELVMGHDDCETDDLMPEYEIKGHEFGWDNESPRRVFFVEKFRIDVRPVTNEEFIPFWKESGCEMPVSWVMENEELKVRTLFGPISMSVAKDWPVLTSYDDMADYARSKGGRIPTEHELRLFLDKYASGYEEGANVGFRNWHPLPATAGGPDFGGKGSNGGVWEWTSTVFDTHDGFVGTGIFPGYSSDFFDGKHQIVLGASYATIPRLAERRTVRNFYQHNYPYPWVAARVAYDD